MSEAKIQALVDRGLLQLKAEVEWRAAAGEESPSEDVKEQVVFASFFKHGLNLLAGDFFRVLLYYYGLELVHLVPNSITVVSTFIHFCEAYLGISPHFLLWRYFFYVKSTGKTSGPVGDVMFNLRSGLKAEWIDTDLPDNTAGWRSEWFYIADQHPGLPRRTGHKLVKKMSRTWGCRLAILGSSSWSWSSSTSTTTWSGTSLRSVWRQEVQKMFPRWRRLLKLIRER
jgi:hypothetical protein